MLVPEFHICWCFNDDFGENTRPDVGKFWGVQAEKTQKNGGMVKCATVLVIMCFIMLVLLILKEIIM